MIAGYGLEKPWGPGAGGPGIACRIGEGRTVRRYVRGDIIDYSTVGYPMELVCGQGL